MDEERASMLPMIAAGEIHQKRETLLVSTVSLCNLWYSFLK